MADKCDRMSTVIMFACVAVVGILETWDMGKSMG